MGARATAKKFADEDAERVVLASELNGGNGEFPEAELFAIARHQLIHQALAAMKLRGTPSDIITLTQELRDNGQLEKAGGAFAITQLGAEYTAKSPEIVEFELGRLRELRAKREQRRIAEQMLSGDIEPADAHVELGKVVEATGPSAEMSIRSPDSILALPRNPRANYLGDWLLAMGQALVIAGIGGIGKTRLLLQLLVAFIIGRPWCGIETHAKEVSALLLQTENGNARLQRDLAALKKWAGKDWKLVEEKLKIHTLETDADSLLHLGEPENARRVEAIICKLSPGIVGLDPLRDFGIGDLNSDADMSATLRELGRVARVGNPNRALITLHHAITGRMGVAKAFGLERTGFARNSKVLHTWARGVINVVPGAEDDNETLILTCGKNSNGKEFPPVAVRLNAEMIYEVADDFDIEDWRREISTPGKAGGVKPQMLRELLGKGREYEKKDIVALIREETGVAKTRAYELVDQAKARRVLSFNKTIKTYALT